MSLTVTNYDLEINEISKAQDLCRRLMTTKHYARMGEEGIFAVVAKAKAMNISPLEALNGGMYSVQGKVEMSGVMMMSLIRQAGHSIKRDPKSTKTHVIMHGKRKDNGDEWTVSFSTDDAKQAGIYKATWEKYPEAMCVWRCVSMLGRYLFADVIKGCYIQGEVSESEPAVEDLMAFPSSVEVIAQKISKDQVEELTNVMSKCDPDYKQKAWKFWKNEFKINSIEDLPESEYDPILKGALYHIQEKAKKISEEQVEEGKVLKEELF